jgi:hypothetical protein
MGFAKEKTQNHDGQSQDAYQREGAPTVALRLSATPHLENPPTTGDALNNNQPQARAVIEAGGDCCFQLKNANRHAYRAALPKVGTTPPFARTEEPDTRHGRLDQYRIAVHPFEPLEAGLPGARTLSKHSSSVAPNKQTVEGRRTSPDFARNQRSTAGPGPLERPARSPAHINLPLP